jgi:hypothetical protein
VLISRVRMSSFLLKVIFAAFLLSAVFTGSLPAQTAMIDEVVQEVSEADNVPVIMKHLPDYEKVKKKAVFASTSEDFLKAVGNHPLALSVAFTPGTEAAIANYDAGKLAIVEFTSPQLATGADEKIRSLLGEAAGPNGGGSQNVPVYRRVGNYAVFVFNSKDEAAAAALIDQVKYEKVVQWLGTNPNILQKKERDYVRSTSEVVLNAIQITGYILLVTLAIGGFAGFMVFRSRNRQRLQADSYTDAGGMTRLNLEASPVSTDKLLN